MIRIKAPGRVCLFGEHQDYLGLPVIAAAINKYIYIRAVPNRTRYFQIEMTDIGQSRRLGLDDSLRDLERRDYFGSGLKVLRRMNIAPRTGYDVILNGDIPVNSGASSSSALVTAWLVLLLKTGNREDLIVPKHLASLAYQTEVLEHNEPGGMMDQYSISYGSVILVESRDSFTVTQLGSDLEGLVLGDSQTPKETLGLLARIRNHVETAVRQIQEKKPDFRLDAFPASQFTELEKLITPDHRPYLEGALQNLEITREAVKELNSAEVSTQKLGSLMNRHHNILRDKLKITTPKIDRMIDTALAAGASGAKINGSGGGGSIVVLAGQYQDAVTDALNGMGAAAYPVSVSAGTRLEQNNNDVK